MHTKRYIITGGGGTGKTTIINQLKAMGYQTCHEVSRELIKEQQAINGSLLPWKDLYGFGEQCIIRMQKQLNNAENELCFYDRGLPDIQAYFNNQGIEAPLQQSCSKLPYAQTVFICPPWRNIFTNDPQRPESFEYSCEIYEHLKRVYSNLGYQLIEIPKTKVESRVNFILSYLHNIPHFKGTLNTLPSVAK